MYLQIKKAELVPDKFGKNIKVTMIGLYENDDTWIKWVKLNEALLEKLLSEKIKYEVKLIT